MAVFTAYSDESGVADPSGEFLVCGYVAEERVWPFVNAAWQERVLDGPPKLPYFHMKEMRRPEWRQQHAITFNDAETRIAQAILVLYGTGSMSALASVINRRDLQDVFHSKFKRKKQVPIGLDEPDYFCFVAYVAFVLGEVYRKYPDATKVNFVVSRKEPVTKRLNSLYKTIKDFFDQDRPYLSRLLGELIPASMEDELPLQAADLLGWHIQKYYANTFDRLEEGRIAMLVKDRDGYMHQWERSELEEMAKNLKISSPSRPSPSLSPLPRL
jgi:hypothetical protein